MKQKVNKFRVKTEEGCTMPIMAAGIMLLIIGVFMFWSSESPVIFYLLPIAGALFTIHEGVEIDTVNKRYREYTSLLFVYVGKWKPLPTIDYITIYRERLHQNIYVSRIATDTTSDSIKVALVYGKNKQIPIGKFESKKDAINLGVMFSKELGVKLLDYTSSRPNWIVE